MMHRLCAILVVLLGSSAAMLQATQQRAKNAAPAALVVTTSHPTASSDSRSPRRTERVARRGRRRNLQQDGQSSGDSSELKFNASQLKFNPVEKGQPLPTPPVADDLDEGSFAVDADADEVDTDELISVLREIEAEEPATPNTEQQDTEQQDTEQQDTEQQNTEQQTTGPLLVGPEQSAQLPTHEESRPSGQPQTGQPQTGQQRVARSNVVPAYPEPTPENDDASSDLDAQEDARQPAAPESADFTLPPHLQMLKSKVETALDIYRGKMLNTSEHCHWSLMHSLIAYGVDKKVRIGGPNGQAVNAIGWICYNYPCRGQNLFYMEQDTIRGRRGPGRQGHEGQFLAMVAQSRVKVDYPMKIEARDLTVRDLVQSEMETCKAGTELTFKLIGIAHYMHVDDQWKSKDGASWNIEKLVREELKQPINGAACGGTHRLYGLTYGAYRCRKNRGTVSGDFERAERFLQQYHAYTFRLQNRDGSFSTEFFEGRGFDSDLKKRILTSGHTAEWLSFSLPKEQLHRPEMVKAIDYLANMLIRGKHRKWEVGPLGHTLHALNLYRERALSPPQQPRIVASLPANSK